MRSSLVVALGAGAIMAAAMIPAAAEAGTHGSVTALAAPARLAAARGPAGPTANPPSGSDPATAVTFAVTSGALTMSVPSTASLGSGLPGHTIVGLLGNVTVTDNRALLNASWTATASSTSFITGTGTPSETIPAAAAAYDPGTVTATGTITITTFDITMSGSPQTVVTGSAGAGNNTAVWDPTIAIAVPIAAVGGIYAGTVTHSVA